MTLHWFDEGDGYHHAHKTTECVHADEVADVMLSHQGTDISIENLPVMSADDAKYLAGRLYTLACDYVRALAAQGTGGEKGR